jgi:hypothetical protein
MLAIITPVHATRQNKRLELLARTLESVRKLPQELIHIVVDDGSSVDVRDVFASCTDSRAYYLRREKLTGERKTASCALNYGINMILDAQPSHKPFTHVDTLTFLHSDDLMLGVDQRLHLLREQSRFVAVTSDVYHLRGGHLRLLPKKHTLMPIELTLEGATNTQYHTIIWKKNFAQYMRRYNAAYHKNDGIFFSHIGFGEDRASWKLTMKCAYETGYGIGHVAVPEVIYRLHPKNISHTIKTSDMNTDLAFVDSVYFSTLRKNSGSLLHPFWRTTYDEINRRFFRPLRLRICKALYFSTNSLAHRADIPWTNRVFNAKRCNYIYYSHFFFFAVKRDYNNESELITYCFKIMILEYFF